MGEPTHRQPGASLSAASAFASAGCADHPPITWRPSGSGLQDALRGWSKCTLMPRSARRADARAVGLRVVLRLVGLAQLLTVRVQNKGTPPTNVTTQMTARRRPSGPPLPSTEVRKAVLDRQCLALAIVEVDPHRRLTLVDPEVTDDSGAEGRVRDGCSRDQPIWPRLLTRHGRKYGRQWTPERPLMPLSVRLWIARDAPARSAAR